MRCTRIAAETEALPLTAEMLPKRALWQACMDIAVDTQLGDDTVKMIGHKQ